LKAQILLWRLSALSEGRDAPGGPHSKS